MGPDSNDLSVFDNRVGKRSRRAISSGRLKMRERELEKRKKTWRLQNKKARIARRNKRH